MRTKRYWVNRYDDFIKKVLGYEILENESNANSLKEEAETYLNSFLPDIKQNPQKAKRIVIFLHINHQLNLLDPIGCCYPGIIDEYADYAKKVTHRFLEEEEKCTFAKGLEKEMIDMWWRVASDPRKDKAVIAKGCGEILQILYDRLLKEKTDQGEAFAEEQFWLHQFDSFLNNILQKEEMQYSQKAVLLQEEANQLLKEKEKNIKDNEKSLDCYISFLYVNHQLNLLDPTGKYYPGFMYPHAGFAWRIIEAYQTMDEEEFRRNTEDIICELYRNLGCDPSRNRERIKYSIRNIMEIVTSLNH